MCLGTTFLKDWICAQRRFQSMSAHLHKLIRALRSALRRLATYRMSCEDSDQAAWAWSESSPDAYATMEEILCPGSIDELNLNVWVKRWFPAGASIRLIFPFNIFVIFSHLINRLFVHTIIFRPSLINHLICLRGLFSWIQSLKRQSQLQQTTFFFIFYWFYSS